MQMTRLRQETGIWILAGVLLVASVCLGLGVFAFNATARIYVASDEVARNWLPSVTAIGRMRAALGQVRRVAGHIVIYGDDDQCEGGRCLDLLAQRRQALEAAEASYAPLVTSGDEERMFQSYRQQRDVYMQIQDQLIARDNSQRDATLEEFITRSDHAYERVTVTLVQLSDFNGEGGRRAQAVVDRQYARTQFSLYALNFLLLGLAAALTAKVIAVASRARH